MVEKNKRKLFNYPWKYKEGFVISGILILLGLIIGYFYKNPVSFPSFPTNLSIVITYTLLLAAFYKFENNNKIIQWLASIPAAITSTVLFTILSVLLGFILQVSSGTINTDDIWYRLGFTHLTTSWLFVFAYLFFITSLGFATVKMFMPFKRKKIGILFSHAGLYIIILAGIAGSGDNIRSYFVLGSNQDFTDKVRAFDSDIYYKTPFKLQLLKFDIIEYNPKVVLVDAKTGYLILPDNNKHFIIDKGEKAEFLNWRIEIKEFLKYSFPKDTLLSSFTEWNMIPALPSAYIEIYDKNNNLINKDWCTCGNFSIPRKNVRVNEDYYFAMLSPEPKEYSSDIKAILPNGSEERFTLKVNSPKTISGWKLYQTGYNEQMGKWSDYSIIEAGRDPWLPAVYTGIFLLIFGAFYLFWLGGKSINGNKQKHEK
ncbi:MAG: cytochrome c biogenesis protein ResB [Bacteroidales bacterium]|nr:cytochrome c biogenesis protein ResB [Bacteroidales bacterium]